jgi:hypothetical protein
MYNKKQAAPIYRILFQCFAFLYLKVESGLSDFCAKHRFWMQLTSTSDPSIPNEVSLNDFSPKYP